MHYQLTEREAWFMAAMQNISTGPHPEWLNTCDYGKEDEGNSEEIAEAVIGEVWEWREAGRPKE